MKWREFVRLTRSNLIINGVRVILLSVIILWAVLANLRGQDIVYDVFNPIENISILSGTAGSIIQIIEYPAANIVVISKDNFSATINTNLGEFDEFQSSDNNRYTFKSYGQVWKDTSKRPELETGGYSKSHEKVGRLRDCSQCGFLDLLGGCLRQDKPSRNPKKSIR